MVAHADHILPTPPSIDFPIVNLLSNVVRSLYSVENRSSQEQLRNDFGEYPPAPLLCGNLKSQFNVVRTRGVGDAWHDLLTNLRLLRLDEFESESLSADLVALVGAGTVRSLREGQRVLGRAARPFGTLLLGIVFLKRVTKEALRGPSRPGVLGCYLPVFKDEGRIVIKTGHLKGASEAHVVTHEHVHVLQHRDGQLLGEQVRSPETLLLDDDFRNPFTLYLLGKSEVEARLHECVLSFYRTHQRLPTTLTGLLGLLAACNELSGVVTYGLEIRSMQIDHELATYPARSASPVEQLAHVLLSIRTRELLSRYITEVLPVMYGNLLRYYGDDDASIAFLEGVERPNLYDSLYAPSGT